MECSFHLIRHERTPAKHKAQGHVILMLQVFHPFDGLFGHANFVLVGIPALDGIDILAHS